MNAQTPSPPHHAPLTQDDVGGVHVKYLHHRHRQLWLYTRGYRPEAGSDLVAFGEAIDATTFGRKRAVTLDALRIDWVDGRLWVHEVKSAQRPNDAHAAQARLYCLALVERGVAVHGATVHISPGRGRNFRLMIRASVSSSTSSSPLGGVATTRPPRCGRPCWRSSSPLGGVATRSR